MNTSWARPLMLLAYLLSACSNTEQASRPGARQAVPGDNLEDVALAAGDAIIVDTTPNFDMGDAGFLPVIGSCTTNSGASIATSDGNPLIDDFDDGDALFEGDGRAGAWFAYGDMTGSQVPAEDSWQSSAGGLTVDGYALHASGGGFSVWGSGQALVFAVDVAGELCAYDASVFDGISFWARGTIAVEDETLATPGPIDRGVLRVLLVEPGVVPVAERGECDELQDGLCWDSHRVRIELGACFRRYVLPFSVFLQDGWGATAGELDTDRLLNMNFEIAQNHSFDFELDELRFFRGEPPTEVEDCSLPMTSADGSLPTNDAGVAQSEL